MMNIRKSPKIFYLLLILLALAACGGEPEPAAIVDTGDGVQVIVPADDFTTGTPRVPFILYAGPKRIADAQAAEITLFDTSQEPPAAVWNGTAVNYSDYEVPYWVIYPEIPQPGIWGFLLDVTLADGSVVQGRFAIEAKAENYAPRIGDTVPASENRTLETQPDLEILSSAVDPNPAFYQMTVAEALADGKPSVIAFNTPAFCQTAVCAPVYNSVDAVYAELADRVNFVHVEIYKLETEPLETAEAVLEWGLQSEPWTFVLDADGKVVARLSGPVSPRELTAALEPLLGG